VEIRGCGGQGLWESGAVEIRGCGDRGLWRSGAVEIRGCGDQVVIIIETQIRTDEELTTVVV